MRSILARSVAVACLAFVCADAVSAQPSRRANCLTIFPDTLITVRTRIHGTIRGLLGDGTGLERAYSNVVSDEIVRPLRQSGRRWSIVSQQAPQNGRNIIIDQVISLNDSGSPYVVTVVAHQGRTRWAQSIARPHFVKVDGNTPVSKDLKLPDGSPYWHPQIDSAALSRRLSRAICAR